MSSSCVFQIGQYEVDSCNEIVPPYYLSIFSNKDLSKSKENIDGEYYKIFKYSITVAEAIKRLELLGYTLKRAENTFKKGIALYLSQEEYYSKHYEGETFKIDKDIAELNFSKLLTYIRYAKENNIRYYTLDEKGILNKRKEKLWRFIFDLERFLGFDYEITEPELVFRTICEISNKNELVKLDYTELVDAGWYRANDDIIEKMVSSNILILTEGSTDAEVLKETLKLLYPFQYKCFSFLDFHTSNSSGGASKLVENIKVFSGTKIGLRIIAIFDNDTIAKEAVCNLKKTTIPKNIKILHLPMLPFAKKYPTEGAQGCANMDINGKAVSIELFYGDDILQDEKGKYVPVIWKGYNSVVNQYQGEVMSKSKLKKAYIKKISSINSEDELSNYDFRAMHKLFKKIFKVAYK